MTHGPERDPRSSTAVEGAQDHLEREAWLDSRLLDPPEAIRPTVRRLPDIAPRIGSAGAGSAGAQGAVTEAGRR